MDLLSANMKGMEEIEVFQENIEYNMEGRMEIGTCVGVWDTDKMYINFNVYNVFRN